MVNDSFFSPFSFKNTILEIESVKNDQENQNVPLNESIDAI